MKKICTTLYVLLMLFVFILPKSVFAQTTPEYRVKSIILIPANFDNEETAKKIPEYKATIAGAIKEIQSWYASKLPGNKTFKFSEQDIEVVKSKKQLTNRSLHTGGDLNELGGFSSLPVSFNNVYVVWIIGSTWKNQAGTAIYYSDQTKQARIFINPKLDPEYAKFQSSATQLLGFAVMSEHSIKELKSVFVKNASLARLAHELGHAFALAYGGYAMSHPCTEISKEECLPNAPQPLPSASEWFQSVVGYGGLESFPNVSFNNTLINPEIQELFKSPFINPQKDPAPVPVNSSTGNIFSDLSIKAIDPLSAKVGDTITVYGSGYGDVRANSYINFVKASSYKSVDEIISWSDKEIKFILPDGAETGQFISLTKRVSGLNEKIEKSIISTKPIEVIEPLENFLNINIPYTLTCGESNQSLELETYPSDPIISLNAHLIQPGLVLASATNLLQVVPSSSTGILSYSVLKRREPGSFSVQIKNIGELVPEPSFYAVSRDDLNNPDYRLNLHYQTCPGKKLTRVSLIEKGSEIGQDPKDVSDKVVLFENGQFLEEQSLAGLKTGDNLFLIKKCFEDGSCDIEENSLTIFRVGENEGEEEESLMKISYPVTDSPVYDSHDTTLIDNVDSVEEKACPPEYNQCGKTYGLEEDEFEPTQTVRITPVCDEENNIIEYDKRLLLEGEEGWDACLGNGQL